MSAKTIATPGPFELLKAAATNSAPVCGLTHNFYRYPARFSPTFAATAIQLFSKPGELVLDPYMGGGTTIVESLVHGRHAIGNDLNELSAFLVKVKTRPLTSGQVSEVKDWLVRALPQMDFRFDGRKLAHLFDEQKTYNLNLPSARPLKKALAGAMLAIEGIRSPEAKAFARCSLLRLGQWHLDGTRKTPALHEARERLPEIVEDMIAGMKEFTSAMKEHPSDLLPAIILTGDAAKIDKRPFFSRERKKADLVVTSPPYPGVHLLYHRWQINGRREAPAPYWLSGTNDGHGAAFYNFADRRGKAIEKYFEVSLQTLLAIDRVVKRGAIMVQMIAFSDPDAHLPRYLDNMRAAGFRELNLSSSEIDRIWRDVPSRKWHAAMKGRTNSSREVVLIHEAV